MVQILIPISSRTKFYPEEDHYFPIPFIEICGEPLISHVVLNYRTNFPHAKFIFVVDKSDSINFSLSKTLSIVAGPDVEIIERDGDTAGGLCSCLLAIDKIDLERPLIIANSDVIIRDNLKMHYERLMHTGTVGLITFESTHPKWSYVLCDDDDNVLQVYEKDVVSKKAIAGFYCYKTAANFIESAKVVLLNDIRTNDKFFISSTINQCLLSGEQVGFVGVSRASVFALNTPKGIENYERYMREQDPLHEPINASDMINILIPAAGLGSRFSKEGWKKPKPFIDVDGSPMIEHVIQGLNVRHSNLLVIFKEEHMKDNDSYVTSLKERGISIVELEKLTEGTACTVLSAHRQIKKDRPLLVVNSDQFLDFDIHFFLQDARKRNLDGSILTFKEASKDPKWSYALVSDDGLVERVAEKDPISDQATVGIYYFARGADFINASLDMIVSNERVNGEFYTCPVYNYLIAAGGRVGVFEIARSDMHEVGTPNDLQTYLSRNNLPQSQDAPEQAT